jgi:Lecithin:cholesterol acyltransferase
LAIRDTSISGARIAVLIPGIMGSTLAYPNQPLWSDDIYVNYALLRENPYLLTWTGRRADAQLWRTVYFLKRLRVVRKHLWGRTLSYLAKRAQGINQVIECGYDWRESLQESCKHVVALIENSVGRALDTTSNNEDPRLVFITHSMGGLLLRVAIGAGRLHLSQIDRIVHYAPPLLGAPVAFRSLVEKASLPYLNEIVGFTRLMNRDKFVSLVYEAFRTFPSLYELLPPSHVTYVRDHRYHIVNPLSGGTLNSQLTSHAVNTHAILAKADQDLYQAGIQVFTIYSQFNSAHKTDMEYRVQPLGPPSNSYQINESWDSLYGDGTVLAESASSSIASTSLKVADVDHAYMADTQLAVNFLSGCGV